MKLIRNLLYIMLLILFLATIIICVRSYSSLGMDNDINPETSYKVIVIDSCEYIFVSCRPWGSDMSLAHKGNCINH